MAPRIPLEIEEGPGATQKVVSMDPARPVISMPWQTSRCSGAVSLIDRPGPLDAESQRKSWWPLIVVMASGADLLLSPVMAYFAFSIAFRDDGVALYGFGIQSVSHFCSSMVLTMKFMDVLVPPALDIDGLADEDILRVQREEEELRERKLAIGLSLTMLLSACALVVKAVRKISNWDEWYKDHTSMDDEIAEFTGILAWWGFGFYLVEAAVRYGAARVLKDDILRRTMFVTLVSMLFCFALGVAAHYEAELVWKADPIIAIFLFLIMLGEDVSIILCNRSNVTMPSGAVSQ